MNYDVKILTAFAMTFDVEGESFLKWLLGNGYPELAALSEAIKGSKKAYQWLVNNKYYHLAAFDSLIDDSYNARIWLMKYNHVNIIYLVDAIKEDEKAIRLLRNNNLEIYLFIAQKIKFYLDNKTFNPHKLNF